MKIMYKNAFVLACMTLTLGRPAPALAEAGNDGGRGIEFQLLGKVEKNEAIEKRAKEITAAVNSGRFRRWVLGYLAMLEPEMIEDQETRELFTRLKFGLLEEARGTPISISSRCGEKNDEPRAMTTTPGAPYALVCLWPELLAKEQLSQSSSLSMNEEWVGAYIHELSHHLFPKDDPYHAKEDANPRFAHHMGKSAVTPVYRTGKISPINHLPEDFYIDQDFTRRIVIEASDWKAAWKPRTAGCNDSMVIGGKTYEVPLGKPTVITLPVMDHMVQRPVARIPAHSTFNVSNRCPTDWWLKGVHLINGDPMSFEWHRIDYYYGPGIDIYLAP